MQELLQQVQSALRGMWKFRWPALILAWVVAVIGTVVVWRIPNQYEATARIYVDTDSILKPLMSGLAVQPNIDQQIGMLSRTLISRPNLEKLVRMADLDLKSESKASQEALIDQLAKNIEIRTAGGVNLYSMAYRDNEPDKAKRVIQSMVSIFVETGLGASRKDTDSAKTFLTEQIKTFEAKLEAAESRLKDFRLQNLERASADGKDAAGHLGDTYAQLEAAKLQLREADRAREAAKRQLAEARGEAPKTGVLPDLLAQRSAKNSKAGASAPQGNFATPEIDSRIDAQKRNLDGLLQRYTEQHPDVVNARRLIKDLEDQKTKEIKELARLEALKPPVPKSAADESLAVQELSRMLATAEVQSASIQARVEEFGSRYAAQREALKSAPQVEAEFSQLNRDYAITKKNYEDLVQRRQSAVMSGELDVASGVADFRLIDPPRVNPKAVYPNRPLLLPLVLLAALGSGLFFAFAASQVRPTFADAAELRAQTGLPLLGVVTMLSTDEDRKRERRSLFRFVSASGGLVGVFVAGLIAMTLMTRYGG